MEIVQYFLLIALYYLTFVCMFNQVYMWAHVCLMPKSYK